MLCLKKDSILYFTKLNPFKLDSSDKIPYRYYADFLTNEIKKHYLEENKEEEKSKEENHQEQDSQNEDKKEENNSVYATIKNPS